MAKKGIYQTNLWNVLCIIKLLPLDAMVNLVNNFSKV